MHHIRILAALIGTMLVASSDASTATAGTLHTLIVWPGGQVLVSTTGTRTGLPSCGAGQPARFAFDSSTAAGKSKLAVLLTAYSLGKTVQVTGTNLCDVVADTETINYFVVVD